MTRAFPLVWYRARPLPYARIAAWIVLMGALSIAIIVLSVFAIVGGYLLFQVMPERPATFCVVALAVSMGMGCGFWLDRLGRGARS
jgi:carbon starvation protein CstA